MKTWAKRPASSEDKGKSKFLQRDGAHLSTIYLDRCALSSKDAQWCDLESALGWGQLYSLTSSTAVVLSPILSQKRMPCSLFSFEEDFRFSAPPPIPTKENLRDAEHWQNDLPSRETVISSQSWKEPRKLQKGDSPKRKLCLKRFYFYIFLQRF